MFKHLIHQLSTKFNQLTAMKTPTETPIEKVETTRPAPADAQSAQAQQPVQPTNQVNTATQADTTAQVSTAAQADTVAQADTASQSAPDDAPAIGYGSLVDSAPATDSIPAFLSDLRPGFWNDLRKV